jgi:beta-barrel assembly-enhancing protease
MHIFYSSRNCANDNIFIKSRVGSNWCSLASNFLLKLVFLYLCIINTVNAELSSGDLDKIEKEFIQLINQSDQVIREPLAVEYINHLGRRLAKHTELHHYHFFLVDSDEINAFAGPGGYIGINSSLILATDNESELAGVMSHELSHVALSHLYRMLEHQKTMRIPMIASALAAIALGAINPTLGTGALMAALTGYAQENINYTRANEKEADRVGIGILYKAGFNPQGMANFFKKMQQNYRYYYTAHIPAILRTHPLDRDRIAEAENHTSQIGAKKEQSSLEYHLFKEQIRVISERKPLVLIDYYKNQLAKIGFRESIYYGFGLTFLKLSKYEEAMNLLSRLVKLDADNLFYQIALAKVEFGLKKPSKAISRLYEISLNYPDNYAAIMAYIEGLMTTSQYTKATKHIRKARLLFPRDLTLCYKLARSYAASKRYAYAYFYQATCLKMQGMKNSALEQLKHAEKLNHNVLLSQRIKAMIAEYSH